MSKTTFNIMGAAWGKAFMVATLCTGLITGVNAAPTTSKTASNENHAGDKVEFKSSLPVTQEEIAAVDVLRDICPKLIGNSKKFDEGYNRLLSDLLPNIQQPVLALKALADDAEYQGKLKEARADANRASVQDNRAVCQDIVHYPTDGKKAKK